MSKKEIVVRLNIDKISDKLYLLLLEEFKKEAEYNGVDWQTLLYEFDIEWQLKCIMKPVNKFRAKNKYGCYYSPKQAKEFLANLGK